MNDSLFEQLLHEEEGTTLDFKRQQYRFSKASDDDKSELLKDILGFANAWRRSDAYILIGVEEVRGGRSNVIGLPVEENLDDHSLQQFVNYLTNRPVRFNYEANCFDGKHVGIIKIENQVRPLYLKCDFGKLKKNEVYVRRGSSTDPTKPATIDEIAQMGQAIAATAMELQGLTLELEYNRRFSDGLTAQYQQYAHKHGIGTNVSKPNPVPPQRFRLQAVAAYLQRPFFGDQLPVDQVEEYWQRASLCNGMMDKVVGLTTVNVVDQVVTTTLRLIPEMNELANILKKAIASINHSAA